MKAVKFNPETNRMEGKCKSIDGKRWLDVSTDIHAHTDEAELNNLQVAVYVMCGGGMLGRFAMSQPADFYIDDRVGRLPYSRTQIMQVIEVIIAVCHHLKKDAHNLPEPKFPGCWVF